MSAAASAASTARPEPQRRISSAPRPSLLALCGISVLVFLCLPILVVVPMSFSSAGTLQFPPPGFSLRWYASFFGDAGWLDAAFNSLLIGVGSSSIALLLGTLAAYGLTRGTFVARRLLEANFIAPMVLPPVIIAVALYIFFARTGVLGSFGGLIAAHAVITTPYVVLLMSLAIQGFDIRIEQVALTLGASRLEMLARVLLPNILPNAAAAWLFAFVISFDEVVVTMFVSGTHLTIPKRMFNELVLQINPTITAIATLLILFSLATGRPRALADPRQGRCAGGGQEHLAYDPRRACPRRGRPHSSGKTIRNVLDIFRFSLLPSAFQRWTQRLVARFVGRLWYDTMLHGKRPDGGPVIFVGLHRNGAIDGYVHLSALGGDILFLVAANLRRNPLTRPLAVGIAVERAKDGRDRSGNSAAVEAAARWVAAGGRIFVYPEGTSTLGPDVLPFHPGAARILARTMELGVVPRLVPVGIDYARPQIPGSRADVTIGPDIDLGSMPQSPSACVAEAHRRIADSLIALAHRFPDEADAGFRPLRRRNPLRG